MLLDEQRFEEWLNLFADDGAYWVPANPGQESPFNHVSLFYDDKHTLTVRVQRLRHPAIHSQVPRSKTVRLVANFKLESHDADPSLYRVISKFVMLEDRPGYDRRLFGGRYTHVLRGRAGPGDRAQARRPDELRSELPCPDATLLGWVPRLAGNAGLHEDHMAASPWSAGPGAARPPKANYVAPRARKPGYFNHQQGDD